MGISISDNKDKNQFETVMNGKTAFITYKRKPDTMHITHTEVPSELEGNGIGSALVKHALQAAKDEGKKVVSHCPFVSGYIERHPEFTSYLA